MLDAQIDRQIDRLELIATGEAKRLEQGDALVVHVLFHPGDALVVDIDGTQDVRGLRAARIEALALGDEIEPGNAELHDALLERRRQLALDPDKALVAGQALAQPIDIHVGQHGVDRLRRLLDIDDAARLGEQRRHADIDGELEPVAIENGRPRRRDEVARLPFDGIVLLDEAELHQPPRDGAEDHDERRNDPADAGLGEVPPRLARAVAARSARRASVTAAIYWASVISCWMGSTPASSDSNRLSRAIASGAAMRIGSVSKRPN